MQTALLNPAFSINNFLELEEIIKIALSQEVSFGKGDPLKQLHFLSRFGIIPKMHKKAVLDKNLKPVIREYLPTEALTKLKRYHQLKKMGLSLSEIKAEFSGNKSFTLATPHIAVFLITILTFSFLSLTLFKNTSRTLSEELETKAEQTYNNIVATDFFTQNTWIILNFNAYIKTISNISNGFVYISKNLTIYPNFDHNIALFLTNILLPSDLKLSFNIFFYLHNP